MDDPTIDEPLHSVAFRVTEAQWRILQERANQEGLSISQLAKAALFEKVGLKLEPFSRQHYGQKPPQKKERRRRASPG